MFVLYGLLGIFIGTIILKYTFKIVKFFGKDPDAERAFGGGLGGTYFFIKLFGMAVVIFSVLYLVGILR